MAPTVGDRISHIKEAIANIRAMRQTNGDEQIKRDPILRAALERFFEIISEASRHIPEEARAAHVQIPWKRIAGIGNFLRHVYNDIDVDVLLNAADDDFDLFEGALDQIVASGRNSTE
ncbi:DUF86 domain-containing protein [Bosea sp. (in: a-proteobacteria)]|uniref:DUF86 domain-containing protein n=1 Tax=Bosea vestrisii TaxID=151416 RepID=A0ABW0HA14_9HYPH|nr:DUF86 domain-containing protein [Bosea sp. (in: a-proteobacteria)]MBA4222451.1 hypothetical protein [Methylobacterium sp.]MBR3189659.1 DUF86 domain-containing protein [Bosea sp. (in: a-proteobacteria)]